MVTIDILLIHSKRRPRQGKRSSPWPGVKGVSVSFRFLFILIKLWYKQIHLTMRGGEA